MSEAYEEIIEGETIHRQPPGARHEAICSLLHERVQAVVSTLSSTRILSPRSIVQISPGTFVRPDLALLTSATGKPWLLAEIVSSEDHRSDTVLKKQMYEEVNVPRLWMIDPRYDNVEVYHGTPHGLALRRILAGQDILREELLPGLQLKVADLFAGL